MRWERRLFIVTCALGAFLGLAEAGAADGAPGPAAAAATPRVDIAAMAQAAARAVTTADPSIDVGDLQLLLDPMTKAEVEAEANAWALLLRGKVREISDAELAVRRKNREIAALNKVKSAAEDVADASAKVGRQVVAAAIGPDSPGGKVELAEAKAKLAKSVEAAKQQPVAQRPDIAAAPGAAVHTASDREVMARAISKARSAAEKSGDAKDIGDRLTAEVREEAAASDVAKLVKEPSTEAAPPSPAGVEATADEAEKLAARTKEAVAAKADTKVQLVDYSTKLATERTALIDRLKVALRQLDKLGGDTKEARAYIDAVSGLKVEVSDYVATIARVRAWLTAEEGGLRWARNVGLFFACIIGAILQAKIVRIILERSMAISSTTSQLLRQFVVTWSGRAIIVAGILAGLAALEINLAPLLAVIGAAGFVVAFALQGTLSNLASGLLILVNKPFDIDDEVEVGGDIKGRVEAVSIFSTYIVTDDGSRKIVPNNTIWGGVIVNRTTGAISLAGSGASAETAAAEK